MDFKHFSHNHTLSFHQVPQGSKIQCSGCKSPGSNNMYACWQCGHFLHDQCYHAKRFLDHPSHALHPLNLVPYPTYQSGSFVCKSCNLEGNGLCYTCSKCEFDMHVHCALSPNSNAHTYATHLQTPIHPYSPAQNNSYPNQQNQFLPPYTQHDPSVNSPFQNPPPHYTTGGSNNPNNQFPSYTPPNKQNNTNNPPHGYPTAAPSTIKHFSHPHTLKQTELHQTSGKICSVCDCKLSGSSFVCTEPHCNFNLHKACFDSPQEIRHESHSSHPLKLITTSTYGNETFNCDSCKKKGKGYAYRCTTCSYDLHMDCACLPKKMTQPDHKHALTLYYSSPLSQDVTLVCDVCYEKIHESAWMYYCSRCDFGTHLECVESKIKPRRSVPYSVASDVDRLYSNLTDRIAEYNLLATVNKFGQI